MAGCGSPDLGSAISAPSIWHSQNVFFFLFVVFESLVPQLHVICTQARWRAATVLSTTSHPMPRLAAAPSARVHGGWGHPALVVTVKSPLRHFWTRCGGKKEGKEDRQKILHVHVISSLQCLDGLSRDRSSGGRCGYTV